MPRLETLKQNQILQVTNPTGVANAAAIGNAAAGGQRELGAAIVNAGKVVGEVIEKANEEEEKLQKNDHKIEAERAREYAKAYADESSDPMGRDKMARYKEKFNELAKKKLDASGGPRVPREIIDIYKLSAASGEFDILNDMSKNAVEGLHKTRQDNYTKRSGEIFNKIAFAPPKEYAAARGSYMATIDQNAREIDEMEGVYTPLQKQTIKTEESAALSTMTVRAFMARKDFKGAEEAIKQVTGKYITGEAAEKLHGEMVQSMTHARGENLKWEKKAEDSAKEAKEGLERKIISDSIADLPNLKSPIETRVYLDSRRMDYEKGAITLTQLQKIEEAINPAYKFSVNSRAPENYADILDAINDGEDVNDIILQKLSNNQISKEVASQLGKAQQMREGMTRYDGNAAGTKRKAYEDSGKILNESKKLFSPRERLEIQNKYTIDSLNGKDPSEAARNAVSAQAKAVVANNKVMPKSKTRGVDVIYTQTSLGDLSRLTPMIIQEARKARASGDDKRARELLEALKKQKQLLGISGAGEVTK